MKVLIWIRKGERICVCGGKVCTGRGDLGGKICDKTGERTCVGGTWRNEDKERNCSRMGNMLCWKKRFGGENLYWEEDLCLGDVGVGYFYWDEELCCDMDLWGGRRFVLGRGIFF